MFRNLKLALLPLILAATIGAPAAFAHAHPLTMSPAANAVIDSPKEIAVHYSEALEPKFSTMSVSDASGKVVSTAASVVDTKDPKLMSVALPKLAPGVYTVNWVTVALDSHRLKGSYTFTVK